MSESDRMTEEAADGALAAMPKGLSDRKKWLVSTIKTALVAESEAQQTVSTAQTECASRSKQVGTLLLEAQKLHPKDFRSILFQVGLRRSRAYDLLRLAGGRTTDEELRKDARERKQKSRAKANLQSDSVTEPNVTESEAPASLPQPEPASPPVTESAEPVIMANATDIHPAKAAGAEAIATESAWHPTWGKDDEYIKRVIETLSYERAHDLLLWLTKHVIAIRPEHGAATKKKAA